MRIFKVILFRMGLAALLPTAGLAQSTYIFSNYHRFYGLDAPVFDADGNRLVGTDYVAVLYGGPTPDALTIADLGRFAMPPIPFTYARLGEGGYFWGTWVEINTVGCGAVAWLQVRAWDRRLGASYEEVASLGLGGYGESNLFQKQGGNPCGLPTLPEPLIGLESFSLLPVIPEPSTVGLLLLGLAVLGLWGRRRR